MAATFTGGFKRAHGAFRVVPLATSGHGSHYGFVENGVVLSKLQPGLATLFVLDDGRVDLDDVDRARTTPCSRGFAMRARTASRSSSAIRDSSSAVPGSRVRDWGPGNWSGSADSKLRTLRAGLCLQESQREALPRLRLLLQRHALGDGAGLPGLAAAVTPCILDMNALEHTYLALYRTRGHRLVTQHLIDGMERPRPEVAGRPAAAALRRLRRQPGLLLPSARSPR